MTLRASLTALYGVAFLASGAVLLAVLYVLMRQSLAQKAPGNNEMTSTVGEVNSGQLADLEHQIRQAALDSLVRQSIVALLVMGMVAGLLGYLMAGRALRPVHAITATAQRVAAGKLSERIALSGPQDEIRELADTFDAMLARLDASFERQRSFVAHASHELRTPLALTRTITEVAMAAPDASADLRDTGLSLLDVIARSERLIEGLLQLASTERDIDKRTSVDLVAVCERAADALIDEYAERGVTLAQHLGPATAPGSAVLLERLATNLLQNAVRHNIERGVAEIRAATVDGRVVLEVTNTGGLVPAAETARLFEPFERLNGERTVGRDAGLGLSIVRAIAQSHGGTATAVPRPGGGLTVTVMLPSGVDSNAEARRREPPADTHAPTPC